MSIFEQYKNSKQLWVVTALVLALAVCFGVAAYLMLSSKPAGPAEVSTSSEAESSQEESGASEEPSESEPEEASSETGESSAPAASRPASSWSAGGTVASSAPVVDITPRPGQALTVSTPGVHSETGTYGSITLSAGGITLKNKTVTGDLLLASDVGDGEVVLESCTVKGQILVEGGATVTLRDVTAAKLAVRRAGGATDLLFKGKTTVQTLTAQSHVTLDESGLEEGYDGLRAVVTERGAPIWQSVSLLAGQLDSVTANDTTNVITGRGARIATVTANARTHLSGGGTVSKLVVANSDVTYESRPGAVDVKSGYSSPAQRDWAIGETDPSRGESGSGSGSSDSRARLARPTVSAAAPSADGAVVFSFDGAGSHVSRYDAAYKLNGVTTAYPAAGLVVKAGDQITVTVHAVSRYGSRYNSPSVTVEYAVKSRTAPVPALAKGSDDKSVVLSFACTDELTALTDYDIAATYGGAAFPLDGGSIPAADKTYTVTKPIAPETASRDLVFSVTARGRADNAARTLWLPSAAAGTAAVSRLATPDMNRQDDVSASLDGALTLEVPPGLPPDGTRYVVHSVGGPDDETALSLSGRRYTFAVRPAAAEYGFSVVARSTLTDAGKLIFDSEPLRLITVRGSAAPLPAPGNLSLRADENGRAVFSFTEVREASGYRLTYTSKSPARSAPGSERTIDIAPFDLTILDGTASYHSALTAADIAGFSLAAKGDGLLSADGEASAPAEVTQLGQPTGLRAALNGDGSRIALSFDIAANAANARHELDITLGGAHRSVTLDPGVAEYALDVGTVVAGEETRLTFKARALSTGALVLDSARTTSGTYTLVRLPDTDLELELDSGPAGAPTAYTYTLTMRNSGATSFEVKYRVGGGAPQTVVAVGDTRIIEVPIERGEISELQVRALGRQEGDTCYLPSLTAVKRAVVALGPPRFEGIARPLDADAEGNAVFSMRADAGVNYNFLIFKTDGGALIPPNYPGRSNPAVSSDGVLEYTLYGLPPDEVSSILVRPCQSGRIDNLYAAYRCRF